jgi:hypothetical protein
LARDDFSRPVVDKLAKRVGMKCSYPDCRAPTPGPDGGDGVTNTGVAAHITAASPGGARYDEALSPEERSGSNNGIWLCQTHAKLIDDELTYTPAVLHDWKETAERMAALEARGFVVRRARPFPDLEKKAPGLIAQMRKDLAQRPLVRQIIVLPSRRVSYGGGPTPFFAYFNEEHEDLLAVMTIMVHVGAIYDVAFNQVPRYNLTEEFVSYLTGET